jgi:hypothetical protein
MSTKGMYTQPSAQTWSWLYRARLFFVSFLSRVVGFLKSLSPQHCQKLAGQPSRVSAGEAGRTEYGIDHKSEHSKLLEGCNYGLSGAAFGNWHAAEFSHLKGEP